jgi:hypothetical protein
MRSSPALRLHIPRGSLIELERAAREERLLIPGIEAIVPKDYLGRVAGLNIPREGPHGYPFRAGRIERAERARSENEGYAGHLQHVEQLGTRDDLVDCRDLRNATAEGYRDIRREMIMRVGFQLRGGPLEAMSRPRRLPGFS